MSSLASVQQPLYILLVCSKADEGALGEISELLCEPGFVFIRVYAVHQAVDQIRHSKFDFVVFAFDRSWRGMRLYVWSKFIQAELNKLPFGLIGPNSCKTKEQTGGRSFYLPLSTAPQVIVERISQSVRAHRCSRWKA